MKLSMVKEEAELKTIILPGYSLHNKEWAEDVAKDLRLETKDEIIVHQWKHWSEGNFSLKYEIGDILEQLGKEKINIVAKSVGTLVAMKLLTKMESQIIKVVLCGIPSTSDVRKSIFQKSLKGFPSENIICFQNTNDPFATYEEVKKFIKEIDPKIRVSEKPRSDHNYPYFEDFRIFLTG